MRFSIFAPAALLAGLASAMPTNSSAIIFPQTYFSGDSISWPVDGKCHSLDDRAPKLDMVGSVRIKGDITCHVHDKKDCSGDSFSINNPGAADLVMIMKWAMRTHAVQCGKATSDDN